VIVYRELVLSRDNGAPTNQGRALVNADTMS
jgi:hypothetical protein